MNAEARRRVAVVVKYEPCAEEVYGIVMRR